MFVLNIIRVLLPCIAAGAVVRYVNVQNEKMKEKLENMDDAGGSRYVIGYPGVICVLMYGCLILFSGLMIYAYIDDQLDWFVGIVGGGFVALSLYGVLGSHVWKIWVAGEQIIYRNYIGIKKYYSFSDITHYTERSDGAIIVYVEKKKIFKIDNNVPERLILRGQMKEKGIPGDIDGMTKDNFVMKTRAVYPIVALMCVVFCGWATAGLYNQIGADNSLFLIMLVCFLISLGVLVDVLTDRMKIEGNQVIRRRGLVEKRFDMSKVDYIRIQEGKIRDNIEFYVDGERATSVWALNQPMKLLEQKLAAEGIKTRKDKGNKKRQGKKRN